MIAGITRVMNGTAYAVDDLAVAFGLLFAVIWGASAVYAWFTVPAEDRRRFFGYYLPAAAGGILVPFASDAVSFYFCFALMALPSWGLVAWGDGAESRRGGALYLIATVAGEALLLAALMILSAEAGSISLETLRAAMLTTPHGDLAFGLVIVAFGLKLGVIGASGILPLTYGYAPGGGAAALAGATAKVGVLGLLRLLPLGGATQPSWSAIVVVLGLLTAFGAAIVGSLTTTPRAVLGYSSASQMGLVLIGIGVGLAEPAAGAPAVAAAVAYSLHHGLAKATLFLGEDLSRARSGRVATATRWALVLPAAALVGLPFTSGFAAKYALKDAVHAVSGDIAHLAEALLPWAAVGTALLMLRFFALVRKRPSEDVSTSPAPPVVFAGMLLLVGGAVWAWPAEWVTSAASSLLKGSSLWSATWPALVAVAVGLSASAVAARVSRRSDPLGLVTPGDVLIAAWSGAIRLDRAWERAASEHTRPQSEGRIWERVTRALTTADATLTVWAIAAGVFVALAALIVIVAT